MKQHIMIAGGSGFMGQALAKFYHEKGWRVSILTRGEAHQTHEIGYVHWDGETLGPWTSALEGATVLVNLAGKSVDCRYTAENKDKILQSRVLSTKVLGQAISLTKSPPSVWLNAGSATIYEDTRGSLPANDEYEHRIGDDFSMNVCKAWEANFREAYVPRTRKLILRTAIVLGHGSAMKPLKNLVRFRLGGTQGSGNQWVSWIHIDDFVRATDALIENPAARGIYNLAAPNPIPNHQFMAEIRKQMGIRWGLSQPEWILRLGAGLIRTEAELILKSRKVISKRLPELGFDFRFPDMRSALNDLLATAPKQKRDRLVSRSRI